MKTIEVQAVFLSADKNLDELEKLGIDVSNSERGEEFDLVSIRVKYIAAFNPTTDPKRTRVWLVDGSSFLINMPYSEFKELYHSTVAKDEIV